MDPGNNNGQNSQDMMQMMQMMMNNPQMMQMMQNMMNSNIPSNMINPNMMNPNMMNSNMNMGNNQMGNNSNPNMIPNNNPNMIPNNNPNMVPNMVPNNINMNNMHNNQMGNNMGINNISPMLNMSKNMINNDPNIMNNGNNMGMVNNDINNNVPNPQMNNVGLNNQYPIINNGMGMGSNMDSNNMQYSQMNNINIRNSNNIPNPQVSMGMVNNLSSSNQLRNSKNIFDDIIEKNSASIIPSNVIDSIEQLSIQSPQENNGYESMDLEDQLRFNYITWYFSRGPKEKPDNNEFALHNATIYNIPPDKIVTIVTDLHTKLLILMELAIEPSEMLNILSMGRFDDGKKWTKDEIKAEWTIIKEQKYNNHPIFFKYVHKLKLRKKKLALTTSIDNKKTNKGNNNNYGNKKSNKNNKNNNKKLIYSGKVSAIPIDLKNNKLQKYKKNLLFYKKNRNWYLACSNKVPNTAYTIHQRSSQGIKSSSNFVVGTYKDISDFKLKSNNRYSLKLGTKMYAIEIKIIHQE